MVDLRNDVEVQSLEIMVQHDSESQVELNGQKRRNAFERKLKFELDGRMMKFKGEPPEDNPEMTMMIGPASSVASTASKYVSPAKQMAEELGFQTKTNKEYHLIQVKRKQHAFSHLGLGIKNLKGNKIIVSRIGDGSYVSNVLQVGDGILAINGEKINDKVQCKTFILQTNGDFETLIERNKLMPEVKYRDVDTFVCTQFIPTNAMPEIEASDDHVGNPLYGYEKSPDDVRKMAHMYLDELNRGKVNTESASKCSDAVEDYQARVNIDDEVSVAVIPSDVNPDRILKTPHRNACLHI